VLDRMEQKGLIQRERGGEDRRQLFVKLTPQGEATFGEIFPQVVQAGEQRFYGYTDSDYHTLEQALTKLKQHLNVK